MFQISKIEIRPFCLFGFLLVHAKQNKNTPFSDIRNYAKARSWRNSELTMTLDNMYKLLLLISLPLMLLANEVAITLSWIHVILTSIS